MAWLIFFCFLLLDLRNLNHSISFLLLAHPSISCWTHLFLRLRNQYPLAGVTSIFPFLLMDCRATPRSQSVFPPTSTSTGSEEGTSHNTVFSWYVLQRLHRTQMFHDVLSEETSSPPSSVFQRRWPPSPGRRRPGRTSPGDLGASGVGLHTSPAQGERHRFRHTWSDWLTHSESSANESWSVSHSSGPRTEPAVDEPCYSPESRPLWWWSKHGLDSPSVNVTCVAMAIGSMYLFSNIPAYSCTLLIPAHKDTSH